MSERMVCAYCIYNDGAVYTSIPPKYKCTITNEFHFGLDNCDVNFAPVKHGKWIDGKCSVCGGEVPYTYNGFWEETPYCPCCGAEMDGDEENNG